MLIGFVLLVVSCTSDYCNSAPVSERIYQTEQECEVMLGRLKERRPQAVLSCDPVWRNN